MGVLAKKSTFLKLYAFFHCFHKKARDYLETMQTIDLHHLQCQTEALFGSFCDENRFRGENFSFAKYINRVILVNVSQLQMTITFFALDRLSQLGAQMKGICQPNPTR